MQVKQKTIILKNPNILAITYIYESFNKKYIVMQGATVGCCLYEQDNPKYIMIPSEYENCSINSSSISRCEKYFAYSGIQFDTRNRFYCLVKLKDKMIAGQKNYDIIIQESVHESKDDAPMFCNFVSLNDKEYLLVHHENKNNELLDIENNTVMNWHPFRYYGYGLQDFKKYFIVEHHASYALYRKETGKFLGLQAKRTDNLNSWSKDCIIMYDNLLYTFNPLRGLDIMHVQKNRTKKHRYYPIFKWNIPLDEVPKFIKAVAIDPTRKTVLIVVKNTAIGIRTSIIEWNYEKNILINNGLSVSLLPFYNMTRVFYSKDYKKLFISNIKKAIIHEMD